MNQPIYPVFDPAVPRFMTLGQILDRIFRLMRGNFRLFVRIGAVPAAAAMTSFAAVAVPFFMTGPPRFAKHPEELLYFFFKAMLAVSVPIAAVFAIYLAAANHAAIQADHDIETTFREAYGLALRHPGRHLGLAVLIFLIAFSPLCLIEIGLFAMVLPQVFDTARHSVSFTPFLIPPGILLAMVYSVFAALRLSLAFPACVSEGLHALAAIRRSFLLTSQAMGRIFVAMLVVYAASYAVYLIFTALFFTIFGLALFGAVALHVRMVPWGFGLAGLAGLCLLAGMGLFYALTWSGYTTALAVIYRDQRRRKDGPPPAPAESDIIPG